MNSQALLMNNERSELMAMVTRKDSENVNNEATMDCAGREQTMQVHVGFAQKLSVPQECSIITVAVLHGKPTI